MPTLLVLMEDTLYDHLRKEKGMNGPLSEFCFVEDKGDIFIYYVPKKYETLPLPKIDAAIYVEAELDMKKEDIIFSYDSPFRVPISTNKEFLKGAVNTLVDLMKTVDMYQ